MSPRPTHPALVAGVLALAACSGAGGSTAPSAELPRSPTPAAPGAPATPPSGSVGRADPVADVGALLAGASAPTRETLAPLHAAWAQAPAAAAPLAALADGIAAARAKATDDHPDLPTLDALALTVSALAGAR